MSPRGWRRVAGCAVSAIAALALPAAGPPEDLCPTLPASGLVTNERAYREPYAPGARLSGDWLVTSGSLFAHHGAGWTGWPDGGSPDLASADATGSAVFRMVSRRADFGDVTVTAWIELRAYVSTGRTPAQGLDGVHFWLRYQSAQELYAVSVVRRDGLVVVKRKVPGGPSNGGTYTTLGSVRHPYRGGKLWVCARVRNVAGGAAVRIDVALDGEPVLSVLDTAPGRLLRPGAVGIRGDNADFLFGDFLAAPSP
ncbi:MAG TPA: hypothetical protein VJT31_05435 [Rugosimonospora sp.]|nr:hypothetical protein [Rugosimonospora sp.]